MLFRTQIMKLALTHLFTSPCVKVKVSHSCLSLCNPMDYTVHEILQARIPDWVALPFSRGSSQPRDWTQVSHIAGGFFTNWAIREALSLYTTLQPNSKCYRLHLQNMSRRSTLLTPSTATTRSAPTSHRCFIAIASWLFSASSDLFSLLNIVSPLQMTSPIPKACS